jgi:uncharacterized membrane protein YebE (DUF533 family)
MDAIEILGSLLGQKAGGSGAGADILKEIFGTGAPRQAPSPPSTPSSSTTRSAPSRSGPPGEDDLERQARELEDLLNIAKNRSSGGATPQAKPQTKQSSSPASPSPASRQPAPSGTARQPEKRPAGGSGSSQRNPFELPDDESERQNEQATILVRAMVQAAKCDGEITRDEQQKIINQLESPSAEAIEFLREEFDRPFDIREFAWSVPVGMEQQVYTMSLIAIDVDSDREQRYLGELAHGLRLPAAVCEQIKQRLTGARVAAAR